MVGLQHILNHEDLLPLLLPDLRLERERKGGNKHFFEFDLKMTFATFLSPGQDNAMEAGDFIVPSQSPRIQSF